MLRVCPDASGRARCQTGSVQPAPAILIVDDHDGFRRFARGLLETAGLTVVEAGDAERRRLERDLHDGAQQRLVTLSLALGMARDRAAQADPELGSLIESASKEAREALTELRELARGIHPAVLTETGLTGAIQALAERSPVATTITAVPDGRFPTAIEATAYFVVSEALTSVAKHATPAAPR